jgi:2-C-methyl-D-erythritol 4-phosphate cytidylyltransferase
MFITALIPAAGQSKRFGSPLLKQYHDLGGLSILERTFDVFSQLAEINSIIVVVPEQEINNSINLLKHHAGFDERTTVVKGGSERQASVYSGLKHVSQETDIVVVHDAARPLVSQELILDTIYQAQKYGACTAGITVRDTIKRIRDGRVIETLAREELCTVQTPQAFRFSLIWQAHQQAIKADWHCTDDATIVERLGHPVHVTEGNVENIKITTPGDVRLAYAILKERSAR